MNVFTILLVAGLIWFARFIFEKVKSAGGSNFTQEERVVLEHGFKGRVRQRIDTLDDGTDIDVFVFQIKGIIAGEYDRWDGVIRIGAIDVTESREGAYPILCAIDAFQRPETCIFEFASEPQTLGEMSYIEEWMTIIEVPVDAMQFARRGRRKLIFFFGVTDKQGNQLHVNGDEVEMEYDVTEPGFVEMEAIQREVDQLTVQLAVLVSAADGVLDKAEGEVVQSWIQKRLSLEEDDGRKTEIRKELNSAVREAGSMRGDVSGGVATICKTIVKKGVTAHRFDALELCLEVAGADGTAEQTELALIEEIAQGLEVDAKRLKEMVEKALPVGMFADKDPDSVIGITPGMSEPEIKKLLNEEYRKWNSRVNHSDKKVREQASEMLALIADARRRHVS